MRHWAGGPGPALFRAGVLIATACLLSLMGLFPLGLVFVLIAPIVLICTLIVYRLECPKCGVGIRMREPHTWKATATIDDCPQCHHPMLPLPWRPLLWRSGLRLMWYTLGTAIVLSLFWNSLFDPDGDKVGLFWMTAVAVALLPTIWMIRRGRVTPSWCPTCRIEVSRPNRSH